MKQKVREEDNVIPFTGYLQPQAPPTPITTVSAINPAFITVGVVLFASGLAFGAISVHQSANYQQLEYLKNQAQELTKAKEAICK